MMSKIQNRSKNEQQYQEILHDIYNPDNLFKNKNEKNIEEPVKTTEMIEYKETLLKKIILKIKKFFHK